MGFSQNPHLIKLNIKEYEINGKKENLRNIKSNLKSEDFWKIKCFSDSFELAFELGASIVFLKKNSIINFRSLTFSAA